MTTFVLDTLAYAETLKAGGFNEQQAATQARALAEIIDRQMVSKTGSLLIVEIEGTQYVVGATDQMVQIMLKLDTPIPYQPLTGNQDKDFKSILKSIIKKDGGHGQQM